MEIKDINNNVNKMIFHFINCLNMKLTKYINKIDYPIIFDNIKNKYKAHFFTSKSTELFIYLTSNSIIEENEKPYIWDKGLIIIDESYKNTTNKNNKLAYFDLLDTIIHEKLHAIRTLSIKDQNRIKYIDPTQDILLGPKLNNEKKNRAKMNQQLKIDESLIAIMSIITWKMYEQKNNDIISIVEYINKKTKQKDIKSMTNIILRHNNLELFKWMVDPLTYQQDDIHYDYFNEYIDDNDIYDLYILTKSKDTISHDKTNYKCLFPKNIKKLKVKK